MLWRPLLSRYRGGQRLSRKTIAVVAVVAGVAVTPAVASGSVRGQAAGKISTIAGSVGGPGKATEVAIAPCGVTAAGGSLYFGTGAALRKVSPTGWLTTVAGTGVSGPIRNGQPAAKSSVQACEVAVDHSGNLIIAENAQIQVIAESTATFYGQAMTAGDIYTVAGNGQAGFSGDGGPATQAEVFLPEGVTPDRAGNLVIADTDNYRIRVVAESTGMFYGQAMTAGDIYTVAGDGGFGYSGDGGPATQAEMRYPDAVAVDSAGNLIIADNGNARIRAVAASSGTFYGQAMTAGDIYTVAGNGREGFSGDGGPATHAELAGPRRVTVDSAGNLIIADTYNNRVRVVADTTGTFYGQAMTADDIYTVAGNGHLGFSGDGGPATQAQISGPEGVALDSAGNLIIADNGNARVRVVAAKAGTFYGQAMTAGNIYTVAGNGTRSFSGDGRPATQAQLWGPEGLALDGAGNLIIADTYNDRIRVTAARTGSYYGQAMTAKHIYTVAGNGTAGYSGDGGPATQAEIHDPDAVAVDGAGNLIIADSFNDRIRLVARQSGTYYGQAMTTGNIYTVAGNGTAGYSGDGGPATQAEIDLPTTVAVDSAGNLIIGDYANHRVRVVAGQSGTYYGQTMTAGNIYTVAGNGSAGYSGDGGPATHAKLRGAEGVAVDGAGNLIIADTDNDRIRVVARQSGTYYGQTMTADDIYTVAGNGRKGFSGNGGPATHAKLHYPAGVAVDSAGNLIIADQNNNRIRVVAEQSGSYYGQAMTTGDIYTVAGNGEFGFSGDGGPATHAELDFPSGVAVDSAGNLLIADYFNERIREVTG